MIRMNILVLCNIDLENKWGDYTRVFSLMQELTKRGHKIFLFIIKSDIKKPRVSYFNENGIETKIYHKPLVSDAPIFKQYIKEDVPNARRVLSKFLSIPAHEKLSNSQIDYVIEKITSFYQDI